MRSLLRPLALLLSAATITSAQRAPNPRDALIVSTAWLSDHLKDPNLVLLHVGDGGEYMNKHIAGARFVQLADIDSSEKMGDGLMLEMPPVAVLRERLAALGISNDSRVIVYYGNDWVSPSTRVILTLDYAGLGDHVSLLDGGMQQWIKDGHPVTDVIPAKRAGTLSALKVKHVVVNAEYVKAHIGKPGTSIVDGRSASFYDGVQTGRGHTESQRTGHIASAKSIPFEAPYDDSHRLRSNAELAAIFAKAGVAPGDTVIGYCHIGQQATAMLFAARLLGHPVLLFDGSFEDWSKRPAVEFPVDNPSAKGKP